MPGGIIHITHTGNICDNIFHCLYTTGGTPYENGLFKMKLVLPKEFPASPPQGIIHTMLT